jgi:hypothetical protein
MRWVALPDHDFVAAAWAFSRSTRGIEISTAVLQRRTAVSARYTLNERGQPNQFRIAAHVARAVTQFVEVPVVHVDDDGADSWVVLCKGVSETDVPETGALGRVAYSGD